MMRSSNRYLRAYRPYLMGWLCVLVFALASWTTPAWSGVLDGLFHRLGMGASQFPVRASNFWVCDGGLGHCIYWLNNDQVLFRGTKPGDVVATANGQHRGRSVIYVWGLASGKIIPRVDADVDSLCHDNGYVRYVKIEGDMRIVFAGAVGSEWEIRRYHIKAEPRLDLHEMGWTKDLSCGKHQSRPVHVLEGIKVGLSDGDGFLFFGKRTAELKTPIHYYRAQSKEPISLPMLRWQISPSDVTPSLNGSYLLKGYQIFNSGDTCVPAGFAQKVYRLWPTGRVETIVLPASDKIRCYLDNPHSIHEVQAGLTVQINRSDRARLYLVAGEELREVVRGWIGDAAVSPDGCRMAVGITTEGDPFFQPGSPRYGRHLKVIDFCQKQKR